MAQQSREPSQAKQFSDKVEQMFGDFFGETEAERVAIEGIPIDVEEERRIGDNDLDTFLALLRQRGIRVAERGRDADYVSSLIQSIHPRMRQAERYSKIRVYVATSKETDARAFPGGSIVVMTGLIAFARSEAALVGVLGHELSHIDHGHQLRMARATKLAQNGWENGVGSPQAMQQQIRMMTMNFARPFRPEDEAAADRDGATWAFELGYEPREMAQLFERLDVRHGNGRAKVNVQLPNFLLTHPSYRNRSASIDELAKQLQHDRPAVRLSIGRANLEQRIPRVIREFPE